MIYAFCIYHSQLIILNGSTSLQTNYGDNRGKFNLETFYVLSVCGFKKYCITITKRGEVSNFMCVIQLSAKLVI